MADYPVKDGNGADIELWPYDPMLVLPIRPPHRDPSGDYPVKDGNGSTIVGYDGAGPDVPVITVSGSVAVSTFVRGGVSYTQLLWTTTAPGTFAATAPVAGVQYALGGGGASGGALTNAGGGGGAGAVTQGAVTLDAGLHTVAPGAGGAGAMNAPGNNGADSTVSGPTINLTAAGGGNGSSTLIGGNGGCGGGAGTNGTARLGGTGSVGGNGGASAVGALTAERAAGGGGGMGGDGANAGAGVGGSGGAGVSCGWSGYRYFVRSFYT